MTQFEVPKGLADMLQSFTVSVLREKPPDIYQFAADYFQRVNEERKNAGVVMESPKKGVSFGVPMQTDSSDDEPIEEPPKNNRLQRRKSVSAERYDPEADDDDEPKVVHPKSDDQRQRLNEATKGILLFRSLDIEQMQDVIDAMFEVKVAPNDHVIDQGDDGDNFYVIDSGTYDIYVEGANENKPVGSYKDTGSFGELALMYNMPRAATIVATSPGSLWAMDRSTFRRIVLKNAFNKRKMYESLLETVPMLSTLTPYERMNIADALVTKQYNDGELIIRQGDSADCMYIIEDGEVKICMKLESGRETETVISTCTKGNYFGELALLTHKPRAASAYAVGPVRLAVLDVEAFERLLGPCYEIMKRTMKDYEDQLIQLFGDSANITDLR